VHRQLVHPALLLFLVAGEKEQCCSGGEGEQPYRNEKITPKSFRKQADQCVTVLKEPGAGCKEKVVERNEKNSKSGENEQDQ
jgi:hypothetical protein